MKKIFFPVMLIACISAQAQIQIPSSVAAAFIKRFPDVSNVKWTKENAKEYEAEFQSKGIKMSANFDLNGNWKETETEIPVKDLPEAVIKAISKKYAAAVISGADKIEKPGGKIFYEAEIKINGKKKEVELYPDGKYVK